MVKNLTGVARETKLLVIQHEMAVDCLTFCSHFCLTSESGSIVFHRFFRGIQESREGFIRNENK